MLDLNLFRAEKGGNPDLIRESQRRRFQDPGLVDEIIKAAEEKRVLDGKIAGLKGDYNALNKQVPELKKAKKDAEVEAVISQVKALQEQIKGMEAELVKLDKVLHVALNQIGNIVHDSVPVGDNEDNNRVEREWNKDKQRRNPDKTLHHHHELLWMIDGYEPNRGANVAGHRGYFLKGAGVALNQALISYGLAFLAERGYTSMQTPFFMKKDIMAETAQLSQFDEELYKVTGGDEDFYLIATSEQPISALHRGEWFKPDDLPLHYAGVSTCFRKEAGAHGRDAWGIFRIHQFEKIEQFVICDPDKSWEELEKMIGIAEEFYRSLEVPYRVVAIVSKELNNAAAKKYDLEAFFPTLETYRELVSCSNCTDYQSRNLNIRYGDAKDKDTVGRGYVHMLNATLCATERTMCCLLENYQTETGIVVPTVLQPYMNGQTFIPFTHAKPTQKGVSGSKTQGLPIKGASIPRLHGNAAAAAATGVTAGADNSAMAAKLAALNEYLAGRSYIVGFTPSQADIDALAEIAGAPHGLVARHFHVDRWFRHIASFTDAELQEYAAAAKTDASVLKQIFAAPAAAAAPVAAAAPAHAHAHAHAAPAAAAAAAKDVKTADGETVIDLFP